MTYNRDQFFAAIKPLFGKLKQSQVDGLNFLLDAWEGQYPNGSIKFLAYCLATAFHETAKTMQPIEEYGKGKGRPYGPTGFYGRGYVQLTWEINYKKASQSLKELYGIDVDLVAHPEKALDPKIASLIMYAGMIEGWFTGKKLADYFSGTEADVFNARRIINGTDRAKDIASYYRSFLVALLAAEVKTESKPLPVETPQESKVEAPQVIVPQETPKIEQKTDTEPKPAGIVALILKLFGVT